MFNCAHASFICCYNLHKTKQHNTCISSRSSEYTLSRNVFNTVQNIICEFVNQHLVYLWKDTKRHCTYITKLPHMYRDILILILKQSHLNHVHTSSNTTRKCRCLEDGTFTPWWLIHGLFYGGWHHAVNAAWFRLFI